MALFRERAQADYLTGQELVDQLSLWLAARYQSVETHLLAEIARQVAAELDGTATVSRLAAIRRLQAAAQEAFAQLDSAATARQVIQTAFLEGEAAALEQLGFAQAAAGGVQQVDIVPGVPVGGVVPFATGITPSSAIASATIGMQLQSDFDDLAARVIRLTPDKYQQTVARFASEQVLEGGTHRAAQARAVQSFLADGISGFIDSSGRNWRIGSYTEMATRTATNRAWLEAHMNRWTGMGLNLVTIVRGGDACARCAAWSGKVLSMDGSLSGPVQAVHSTTGEPITITVEGSVASARAGGWNHPNCRCTLTPVFPGLSLPVNDSTYDPQAEKNREKLRYLERRVREFKSRALVAEAMGDDVSAAFWRSQARAEQARIRDWVEQTGQVRKPYREQLSFATGRVPAPVPPIAVTAG